MVEIRPHLLDHRSTALTVGVSIISSEGEIKSVVATDRHGQQLYAAEDIQHKTSSFLLQNVLRTRFPMFVRATDMQGETYKSPALFPAPTDPDFQNEDAIFPLPPRGIDTRFDPIIRELMIQARNAGTARRRSLARSDSLHRELSEQLKIGYFYVAIATSYVLATIIIAALNGDSWLQLATGIGALLSFLAVFWLARRVRAITNELALLSEEKMEKASDTDSAAAQLLRFGVPLSMILDTRCSSPNCEDNHD